MMRGVSKILKREIRLGTKKPEQPEGGKREKETLPRS